MKSKQNIFFYLGIVVFVSTTCLNAQKYQIPASVIGSGGGVASSSNFRISSTAGGSWLSDYHNVAGFTTENTNYIFMPLYIKRTYYKNAGKNTFQFEAMDKSGFGSKYIFNAVITATFFPTNYGTVTTLKESSVVDINQLSISNSGK